MNYIYCWCRYFFYLISIILLRFFLIIDYCFVLCFYFIVCKIEKLDKIIDIEYKILIDFLEIFNKYKGCIEIDGNLIIKIRGSGGLGLLILVFFRIVYINI